MTLGVVVTDIERADAATVDALAVHGVATVHEAMGRVGLVGPGITPIQLFVRKISSAFTTSSRRSRFSTTFRRFITHSRITPARAPVDLAWVLSLRRSIFFFVLHLALVLTFQRSSDLCLGGHESWDWSPALPHDGSV